MIEDRLGSGATGTVYKALDRYRADLAADQQSVAIKILHRSSGNPLERLAELRREFYCTQMLSHPNIVKVYELDRDGDTDFFAMELLEGELLADVTARFRRSPLMRAHAWKIIHEIGAGLAHAHAREVVHADLKPRNISITHAGEVRILDFGASVASAARTPNADRRGTASSDPASAYASCELLEGRAPDPRDDIYAFACIAYELLAGAHPFQRRPSTVARDLGIVAQRPPELTRRQWHMLSKGLSWHRAGRSVTIAACLTQLNSGRMAARQLPGVRELKSAPLSSHRPAGSLTTATLYAAMPIAAGVGVLLLAHSGPTAPNDGAHNLITASDVSPESAASPTLASATPSALSAQHSVAPSMSAADYTVRAGEHFAEIRVHRSSRMDRNAEFVWWTEPASAKPGIDYIPLGKVTQAFPKGKSSTSFFIKLLPNASRTVSQVFYVAIETTVRGALSGQVARAAVRLPTAHAQS